MRICIWCVAGLFLIVAVNAIAANNDKARAAEMTVYESCVQQQYGVSAAHFYAEHGYAPEC